MIRFRLVLASLAILAAPALAATPEEDRARLNAEQAAAAKAQVDQNTAAQAAYEAAVKAREEAIAAQAAAQAQAQADYEAATAKWQADNAACQGGDKVRCAAPAS